MERHVTHECGLSLIDQLMADVVPGSVGAWTLNWNHMTWPGPTYGVDWIAGRFERDQLVDGNACRKPFNHMLYYVAVRVVRTNFYGNWPLYQPPYRPSRKTTFPAFVRFYAVPDNFRIYETY